MMIDLNQTHRDACLAQAMAMKANSAASSMEDARPLREIEMLTKRIQELASWASVSHNRLVSVSERLFGPDYSELASGESSQIKGGEGELSALREVVNKFEQVIRNIDNATNRLEQI